jgi:hypothetical protein
MAGVAAWRGGFGLAWGELISNLPSELSGVRRGQALPSPRHTSVSHEMISSINPAKKSVQGIFVVSIEFPALKA